MFCLVFREFSWNRLLSANTLESGHGRCGKNAHQTLKGGISVCVIVGLLIHFQQLSQFAHQFLGAHTLLADCRPWCNPFYPEKIVEEGSTAPWLDSHAVAATFSHCDFISWIHVYSEFSAHNGWKEKTGTMVLFTIQLILSVIMLWS